MGPRNKSLEPIVNSWGKVVELLLAIFDEWAKLTPANQIIGLAKAESLLKQQKLRQEHAFRRHRAVPQPLKAAGRHP